MDPESGQCFMVPGRFSVDDAIRVVEKSDAMTELIIRFINAVHSDVYPSHAKVHRVRPFVASDRLPIEAIQYEAIFGMKREFVYVIGPRRRPGPAFPQDRMCVSDT